MRFLPGEAKLFKVYSSWNEDPSELSKHQQGKQNTSVICLFDILVITVFALATFKIPSTNAPITDHVVCCVSSLQIYKYEKARGSGYRCKDACDFAVKPEDGRDVNGFCCNVKFQQEGDDEEHSFYLNPGFTPLKVEKNTWGSLFYAICATKAQWTVSPAFLSSR